MDTNSVNLATHLDKLFIQDSPRLGNQYSEDSTLLKFLSHRVAPDVLQRIEPDLFRFGMRCITDIPVHGRNCERNPPKLRTHEAFGALQAHPVECHPSWKRLQDIAADEGLVSLAFTAREDLKEFARLLQMVKNYLFAPPSAVFGCPLSMTDGAIRVLELFGTKEQQSMMRKRFLSRKASEFWTSGQWMSERTGGSDVSRTETIAIKDNNTPDSYRLFGYKFFTSSVTSETALLLAKIAVPTNPNNPLSLSVTNRLSCFLISTHLPSSLADSNTTKLNNMTIPHIKEKLGTRALPTCEVQLNGSVGRLVGSAGNGIKVISEVLTVTRLHAGVHNCAAMRRAIAVARDFSCRRCINVKLPDSDIRTLTPLSENYLHLETLAKLQLELTAALFFCFDVILLFGKVECRIASDEEVGILRILIPLVKLFTAKQAISVCSEAMECLGGTGCQ